MVKYKQFGHNQGPNNPMYGIHLIPWNKDKKMKDLIPNYVHPRGILGKTAWNKGLKGVYIVTAASKEKNSITQKNQFKNGRKQWNVGIKQTEEAKEKNRQSQLGPKNHFYGKHHTEKTINNLRLDKRCTDVNKGSKQTKEHRRKIRESTINYQEKIIGRPLVPCIGRQEKPILDNLEKQFNYPIIRQHYVDGYWLDGYCPSLNIAIEVDEPHHNRPKVKKHDEEKEEYVKDKLKCSFLRIPVK